jgi:heme exporter protein B
VLVAVLILLLYVPFLVFGVAASSNLVPGAASAALMALAALSLAALVMVPIAAAAALRSHMR